MSHCRFAGVLYLFNAVGVSRYNSILITFMLLYFLLCRIVGVISLLNVVGVSRYNGIFIYIQQNDYISTTLIFMWFKNRTMIL